jgi:hypothetical protein
VTRRSGGAALAALLAVALAAPGTAAAQRSEVGFSISAEGAPSFFRYHAPAGARIAGALVLRSESDEPERVVVRAVDVTTAATGGLDYASTRPAGVGAWIRLESDRVMLAPGTTARVPFIARVPADARPGDHLAGIVAINRSDLRRARRRGGDDGFSLRFLPRLAIATWFTVPGPREPALAVGNAGFDVTPSGSAVAVLVRNTGNVLVRRTTGRLRVLQGGRELSSQPVRLDAFVPDTEIRYRVGLRGTPARGEYRVVGTLRPAGAAPIRVDQLLEFGADAADELRAETGQEAQGGTPPWMWALLGFVALLAAAFGAAWLHARRSSTR